MLRLFKVTYEKIDGKELPEKLYDHYCNEIKFDLYNDEIIFYVLAGSVAGASDGAWASLPVELEDYFEEVSIYDIQGSNTEYNFIKSYQEELKIAKNIIINTYGYLGDKQEEYFDTYLKEE